MSLRAGWTGLLAVLCVAAVVASTTVAQDLDEDGLIVSEEILVEDAVNGELAVEDDFEVDDLVLDDLPLDEEDLEAEAGEPVDLDAVEEEGVPPEVPEAETEALEMAEVAAEEAVEEVAAPEDDLDALVAAAFEDALAEGIEPPPFEDIEEVPEEPAIEEAVIEEAVAEEPAVEEAVLEEALIEEPAVEEAIIEEAVAEEPAVEEAAIEEALIEEPAVEEAVVEEAVAEADIAEDVLDESSIVGDEALEDESLEEALLDDIALEDEVLEEDVVEIEEDIVEIEEDVAEENMTLDLAEAGDAIEIVEDIDADAEPMGDEAMVEAEAVEMDEADAEPAMDAAVEKAEGAEPVMVEEDDETAQVLDVMINQEKLRRQALAAHGQDLLMSAEQAFDDDNYSDAERLFEQAIHYVPDRPEMAKVRARIRTGMAQNYFKWAVDLRDQGDIDESLAMALQAKAHRHPGADRLIEELRSAPEDEPEEAPKPKRRKEQQDFVDKQARIAELLREGHDHLRVREFDRAQEKFEAVLQPDLDPQNTEAIRMIHKIARTRYDRASMEYEATRTDLMTEVRRTWLPRDRGQTETSQRVMQEFTQEVGGESDERIRIRKKMEQIRIPEIDFRTANIHDVIDFLQEASVEFDTDPGAGGQRGVNIILNLGQTAGSAPAPKSDDPFAEVLDGGGGGGGVPLITFSARYISLLEALRIVTEVAYLKYRIEGSVVMIVPHNAPDGAIFVRMYDVLPAVEEKIGTVESELQSQSRDTGDFIALEGSGVGVQGADWKAFFKDMGVQWPEGSSVKYVRTIGKIIVANTERNLSVFEQILEVLNVVPSQIEIEARFVEVTQTDLDSLGFEWLLNDNWEVAQRAGQGNVPPSARERVEVAGNAAGGGFTRGNRFIPEMLADTSSAVDDVLRISSVLTNPELTFVLHALQQRGASDLLSAPKVTTKSGTEAQIKVVTEYIYPTEFTVTPITATEDGVSTIVGGVVEPSAFETREVGVVLAVLPEVSTEGQMINLNMTPEVVTDPTWYEYGSEYTDSQGNIQRLNMPQPFFHSRSVSTSISIYNGATVVMGGMITESRVDVDDKVPFLGDIPLLGRLFRSRYENSEKKNLLIFVTARLVDPAGLPLKQSEQQLPEGLMPDESAETM